MTIFINLDSTVSCNRTLVLEADPKLPNEVVFLGFRPNMLYTIRVDSKIDSLKEWFGSHLSKRLDEHTIQINTKDYKDSNILQMCLFTKPFGSELIVRITNDSLEK